MPAPGIYRHPPQRARRPRVKRWIPTILTGTQYPQALDLGVTLTPTLARSTGKLLSLAITLTTTLSRSVGKLLALGVTLTALITNKAIVRNLALSITATSTLNRAVSIGLALAITAAPVFTRRTGKLLAVGVTGTASLSRSTGKLLSRSLSLQMRRRNSVPPLSQWSVAVGTPTYDSATGVWTFTTNGDSIQSPFVRATPEMATDWIVRADFATDLLSTQFSPDGGMLWGTSYWKEDQSTPALNSLSWTGNGNAQAVTPDGSFYRKAWQYVAGNEVRWIRWNVTKATPYVGSTAYLKVKDVDVYFDTDAAIDDDSSTHIEFINWENLRKQITRAADVIAMTATPTLSRSTSKLLSISATLTPLLSKGVGKLLSLTIAAVPTLPLSVGKLLSLSITLTPVLTLQKLYTMLMSLAVTWD